MRSCAGNLMLIQVVDLEEKWLLTRKYTGSASYLKNSSIKSFSSEFFCFDCSKYDIAVFIRFTVYPESDVEFNFDANINTKSPHKNTNKTRDLTQVLSPMNCLRNDIF